MSWEDREWFDRQQKFVGVVSVRFTWVLNAQRVLSVSTGKNFKD
jgi:hypothetical protein